VIIDLHEHATVEAFALLSGHSHEMVVSNYRKFSIFKDHEKGLISNEEFRNRIKESMKLKVKDDQIDLAWSAMLGDIPIERLTLLSKLKKKYKVLVLSNSNAIHEPIFIKLLKNCSGGKKLEDFVDQVYFSHHMKMRKPDREIYLKVLELSKTKPEEALFIDDKKENIEGAEAVGIQTMHITNPNQIFELEQYV
jgi:putative hydrolase of the HAD superfamily